jgi:H+-translocating NAD(P) transhydrogenase subunit beta
MNETVRSVLVPLIYLLSATLFIFGLKRLGRVKTARGGNVIAAVAMMLAVVGTLLELGSIDYRWILAGLAVGTGVGAVVAYRVPMTSMPEMVALLNGFGGAASALVALSIYWVDIVEPSRVGTIAELLGGSQAVTVGASILIGSLTLSGSLVAYLKLNGSISGKPILVPGRHVLNGILLVGAIILCAWHGFFAADPGTGAMVALALTGATLLLGVLLVIPIGGADMPVVVSLLNSYSGVAACATGFVLNNYLLIISGAMVGAAGLILTRIMCHAMNRSLASVVLGGFGGETGAAAGGNEEYANVRSAGPEEVVLVLDGARNVVVVPGYGLAVAQAQHTVRELADLLGKRGTKVTYAIHPVAGRMPGHMNVLLAEADVPYEALLEMEQVNPEFKDTDVVLVLGANDVVNPAAVTRKDSPIFGMPILEVHQAKNVFVVKRSLGSGYAGVKNDLFEYPNTTMIFGDAKKVLQDLVAEMKQL